VKNRFNFVSTCFKFVLEVVEGMVLTQEKMKKAREMAGNQKIHAG
jgi:hypothetical protein